MGGQLVDEWFRRIDVCLDLPGVDVGEELVPAAHNDQFVASGKRWKRHDTDQGKTGFEVGSRNALFLRVYDKLLQTRSQPAVYQTAMEQRRWNGELPKAATRVEYSIAKAWLDRFGLSSSDEVLRRLPDIMARVIDGPFVLFRMTDRPVLKGTKNQSRIPTHPLWEMVGEAFKEFAGPSGQELEPIERGTMALSRIFANLKGYITTAAVEMGMLVESFPDAISVVRELNRRNEATDSDWQQAYEPKARKSGLSEDMTAFPFGDAA